MDTIKLVAYRAETALSEIVRDKLSHPNEARALVCELFRSSADIIPDEATNILKVRIHSLASPRTNLAAQHLLEHLNATEVSLPRNQHATRLYHGHTPTKVWGAPHRLDNSEGKIS